MTEVITEFVYSKELPLTDAEIPIFVLLAYPCIAKCVQEAFFQVDEREARLKLNKFSKLLSFLYDTFMLLISAMTCFTCFCEMRSEFSSNDTSVKTPFHEKYEGETKGALIFACYAYYITCYIETFGDIITCVSRCKMSWFNLYHHAGTILATWLLLDGKLFILPFIVAINSFMKTLVYLYYFGSDLGSQPHFRSVLSFVQVMQLVFMFVFVGLWFLKKYATSDKLMNGIYVLVINVSLWIILIFSCTPSSSARENEEETHKEKTNNVKME